MIPINEILLILVIGAALLGCRGNWLQSLLFWRWQRLHLAIIASIVGYMLLDLFLLWHLDRLPESPHFEYYYFAVSAFWLLFAFILATGKTKLERYAAQAYCLNAIVNSFILFDMSFFYVIQEISSAILIFIELVLVWAAVYRSWDDEYIKGSCDD